MKLEKAIKILKSFCSPSIEVEAIDTVLKELNRLQKSEEDLMMKAGEMACMMSLEADKLAEELITTTRTIKIKDEYLQLIDFLLVDYDGCKSVETLKELIDETREYIHKALKNDDKSVTTVNSKKKFNILGEEVE